MFRFSSDTIPFNTAMPIRVRYSGTGADAVCTGVIGVPEITMIVNGFTDQSFAFPNHCGDWHAINSLERKTPATRGLYPIDPEQVYRHQSDYFLPTGAISYLPRKGILGNNDDSWAKWEYDTSSQTDTFAPVTSTNNMNCLKDTTANVYWVSPKTRSLMNPDDENDNGCVALSGRFIERGNTRFCYYDSFNDEFYWNTSDAPEDYRHGMLHYWYLFKLEWEAVSGLSTCLHPTKVYFRHNSGRAEWANLTSDNWRSIYTEHNETGFVGSEYFWVKGWGAPRSGWTEMFFPEIGISPLIVAGGQPCYYKLSCLGAGAGLYANKLQNTEWQPTGVINEAF